jgi:hypothetical protein
MIPSDLAKGVLINGTDSRDSNPKMILPGTIFVSEETCKKYGPAFLRKINSSPSAEIVVLKGSKE